MDQDFFRSKNITDTSDKIIVVLVDLCSIILRELSSVTNIHTTQNSTEVNRIVKENLNKILEDKRYEEFIKDFNIIYTRGKKLENTNQNSEERNHKINEDLWKINKILLSLNSDKVRNVYRIIKLICFYSEDECERESAPKLIEFKSPAYEKMNKVKDIKNMAGAVNENIKNKKSYLNKKQKADFSLENNFSNAEKEKTSNSPSSIINNIENNFNKNLEKEMIKLDDSILKNKMPDELKSICTQSTKNQSFSIEPSNYNSVAGNNIRNLPVKVNNSETQIKFKDKLITSAKLFQLPFHSGTNIKNEKNNFFI